MNDEPAGVDFGAVEGVPLPAALEELLGSLEPARGPRHGRMPSSRPLRQTHQRQDPGALSQRLGFPVPTLSVLRAQGQLEYCSPPAAQLRSPQELGVESTRVVCDGAVISAPET